MTLLGICDDVSTCDCCGRKDLKRVVAFETGHGVVHYGTTCASRAFGFDVEKAIRVQQAKAADAEQRLREQAHRAAMQEWQGWLAQTTGISDIFRACESLGGFAKARQLFRERK